jgi:phosphoglucosamine mutase
VRESGADVGIAFDGDADRVIFSDAEGNIVDGDRILALCALDYKQRGLLTADSLVVTTMSNLGLHDAMREHGIRVEVTEVGDRYVLDRMRERGYALGGEKSGHLIFLDYATTGDGIIAALQVLKVMKQTGKSLKELADCMHEYPQKQVNVPVREKRPLGELPIVQGVLRECLTAMGENGRAIVRYSGTENKLRILVESRDPDVVDYWTHGLVEAVRMEIGV